MTTSADVPFKLMVMFLYSVVKELRLSLRTVGKRHAKNAF